MFPIQTMSQMAHLIVANNVGCGMSEGRCLPCSGVSGRTAVYSCSSLSHDRIHSHVKIRVLKCASVGASIVCKARRNPDFSRQNKHGSSRSRNRHNEARDSFENFEEDMLSLKNGPLASLSEKSQATAVPGPREKEIVELFRKVQARLRERAATKEEKKVEASQGHGKENGTVDSLLRLLKKHSVEKVKRNNGGGRGKDSSLDRSQESSQYSGGRSTKLSDLDNAPKDESQESNISSMPMARPRSNFRRSSPVPRVKYQPVSYIEDDTNAAPLSSGVRVNDHDQIGLKLDHKAGPDSEQDLEHELEPDSEPDHDHELEPDSEPDLVPKDELFFPDIGIADLSDDDSHDSEHTYNDEHAEEQLVVQHEDLSALKLPELRALAKSRGLKGFSKLKKVELVEMLTGSC